MNRRKNLMALGSVGFLISAACGGGQRQSLPTGTTRVRSALSAQVASYDLVAGRSGRFIVGLLASDQSRLVAFGSVELRFAFLGDRRTGAASAAPGTPVTATFLPIPGQKIDLAQAGPRLVAASEGIGVYGAPAVLFDKAGFWRVIVAAAIAGKTEKADAAFEVTAHSAIPAVGDQAPRSENPVLGAVGVEPKAIDSRAGPDEAIPDPELHATIVAAALDAHRPLMVVISTPTYCQSRFCGPITDNLSALAKQYGDRMAFVHLEVWKNFDKNEINKAAAEWIFPAGSEDAREPWVFVVDGTGVITRRFDNVATDDELTRAVRDALA